MDFIKVKSLDQATTHLATFILNHSSTWTTSLEEGSSGVLESIRVSTTAEEVEYAVNDLIQRQFTLIQNESADTLDDVDLWYTCVECYVTALLHDVVFCALCAHLERHDRQLQECCINRINDGAATAVVPLTAAIVELSNLDAHTTALEKLACLCTSHDLVYAELKAALIDLQAEAEIDAVNNGCGGMVVVEREEVVALLVSIIARSKPYHIYTNLYYMQAFGAHLFNSSITRQIYEAFCAAVERLSAKNATEQATPLHQRRHLALKDIVQLAASDNSLELEISTSSNKILCNQRRRLLNLITSSTTQHLSL